MTAKTTVLKAVTRLKICSALIFLSPNPVPPEKLPLLVTSRQSDTSQLENISHRIFQYQPEISGTESAGPSQFLLIGN